MSRQTELALSDDNCASTSVIKKVYAKPSRRRFENWAITGHRRDIAGYILSIFSLVLMLVFWYFATKYHWEFYVRFSNIPSPSEVYDHLSELLRTKSFYSNVAISFRRIVIGFSLAAVFGISLGLLIGRYRVVRDLLFTPLEILRPIPAIAWVPISIMLWPSNESSIVFITYLGAFFPILFNTVQGVRAMDSVYLRAASCLGASEFSVLREVILPGSLSYIFTGLAVGMGVAWVSLIAAEMISGQFGIGYFTWESYSLIQYPDIVIGMLIIGMLGLACSSAIRFIGKLCMPWASAGLGGGK